MLLMCTVQEHWEWEDEFKSLLPRQRSHSGPWGFSSPFLFLSKVAFSRFTLAATYFIDWHNFLEIFKARSRVQQRDGGQCVSLCQVWRSKNNHMISHRIGKRTLNVLRYGQVTFIGSKFNSALQLIWTHCRYFRIPPRPTGVQRRKPSNIPYHLKQYFDHHK